MNWNITASLLVAILAFSSQILKAQEAEEDPDEGAYTSIFRGVEFQLGSEVPVHFGGRVRVLLPSNIYVLSSIGYSTEMYADGMASLGNALGMMGVNQSRVVSQALQKALYMDFRVGYKIRTSRNFFDGFYLDLGYSLLVAGGGTVQLSTLTAATGTVYTSPGPPDVKSTLHSVVGHLGYTFSGLGRIIVSGEAGLIKPVASVNRVVAANGTSLVDMDLMQNDVNRVLDNIYKNSLLIPTFSLWVSYRF